MKKSRLRVGAALAALSVALAWGLTAWGQNGPSNDTVVQTLDAQVDRFFDAISTGEAGPALETLLAGNNALLRSASLAELQTSTAQIPARFGAYRGHEQVSARRIGQDLVLLKYLYKCERFPVVWHFAYYRTSAADEMGTSTLQWTPITVRFDTDLELLALEPAQ
jgi:hypothetical protein